MRPLETRRSDVESLHSGCFACGDSGEGLGLRFKTLEDGSVLAEWFCAERYQGYNEVIHGGITATLLDAAMTNCLLSRGVEAVTTDLQVRYKAPLRQGKLAQISARMMDVRRSLYFLEARIEQEGVLTALAHARFMKR